MSVNLYNATTDTLKNIAGDIVNPKSVNEMIAPIEDGTASKAYAVGEQFIMNDLLCEATQAIAQGDTMVIGTNCEESEQLSKQVKDIKSDLSGKVSSAIGCVDVTDLFTINTPSLYWNAIFNPKSNTITINIIGRGSFPNGSIRVTAPAQYKHGITSNLPIGALGSYRDNSNNYGFTIAKYVQDGVTIEVDYDSSITAEEVSFSTTYTVV